MKTTRNTVSRFLLGLTLSAVALAGCGKTPPDTKQAAAPEKPEPATDDSDTAPRKLVVDDESLRRPGWKPFRQWGLRETAIDALARIGKPAVPALVEALHDLNPELRDQAALALARIGPQAVDAVPDLIAALRDDDETVRKDAVRALGQIGPQAAIAVPELIEVLREAEATKARSAERGARSDEDTKTRRRGEK